MKRIAIIACLILLIPAVGWGQHWPFMEGGVQPPSWGTYIFAYDASVEPGSGIGWFDSGKYMVRGVNTGGTFGFDGQRHYWERDADNDRLVWNIPSGYTTNWWNADGGFTVYAEIYVEVANITTLFYLFYAYIDATNYIVLYLNTSEQTVMAWPADTKADTTTTITTLAWTNVAGSLTTGAGVNPDIAADNEGGTEWDTNNQDPVDLVGTFTSIMIGENEVTNTGANGARISKLVILPSFLATRPW